MTSIGSAQWKQSSDEKDPSLEVTVPLALPPNVRIKDLQVLVKDGEILCIKLKESVLLQWRLYARILPDVEWDSTDSGASISLEIQKKEPAVWPCLLNLPMKPTDKIFTSEAELDALFAKEIKPLPPIAATQENADVAEAVVEDALPTADESQEAPAEAPAETTAAAPADDIDLDALLDQAADEIVKKKDEDAATIEVEKAAGEPQQKEEELDMYVRAELKGLEEEEKEISAKLQELEELAADDSKPEDTRRTAERQTKIVERMLEVHRKLRDQRTQPSTLKNFLLVQELDLLKARCNVGEVGESEQEPFASAEERELTPHELMSIGIHHLQQQDLAPALHFLRLAAIHHKHPTSTTVLLRLYSELGSPRGMYLLLKRALLDTPDLDPQTNLQAAELIDKGARHFPSIFPAAIFFYQRAALAGSVHAMMAMAQLFLRGATSATTMTDERRKENVCLEKYHAWLQLALDRGASSAYFVKGCMYLRGEHGLPQSYKDAKNFLELALLSQPDLVRRAPNLQTALEKLRIEEEARSPTTPQSPAPSPTSVVQKAQPATRPASNAPAPDPAVGLVTSRNSNRIAERMAAFENEQAVDLPRVGETKKGGLLKKGGASASLSSGVSSRIFWERVGTTGFTVYAAYSLLFPIRIMMLPHFYTIVGNLLDRFGSLGGGSGRSGLL